MIFVFGVLAGKQQMKKRRTADHLVIGKTMSRLLPRSFMICIGGGIH